MELPSALMELDKDETKYPPPTEVEEKDPNSVYCATTKKGSKFISSKRHDVQNKLKFYVGIGPNFLINVHPAVNAKGTREQAVAAHVLALIQQEFQLNAAWLEKIYNNVRKKLCERKSYQKTKKDLEHQKETAMKQQNKSIVEGEKMGSLSKLPVYSAKDALEGGRDVSMSSSRSSRTSSGSSGADSDSEKEEHYTMSSTLSSLNSMQIGTIGSGTSTRVVAPNSATDATQQAEPEPQFQPKDLPKISAKSLLDELNKRVGKQDK